MDGAPPLSSAFTVEDGFESTLPLAPSDLLAHGWTGLSRPSRTSGLILVETWPSANDSGFVHYSCVAMPGGLETYSKRAFAPKWVGMAIDLILKNHGSTAGELTWTRMRHSPRRDGAAGKHVAEEFVYFVTAGAFVKIGKTTGQPGSRMAGLQTGCPYPMTLAAHEPGGIKEEFALHRRFAAQRVRADGEWFHNEGPLRAYVQALAVKKIPAGTVNQ
ncbi:GIY-YIG nuclease family protein [Massilia scottii]|uniref:GIY-YIG nuclease family protein n=1 Tax=Massilia scottii TaxID=3057166 RepID=UPI002796B348|nr:GIY-YIG nuclease family protein [Massilia sp. CCM 9029]MDQ1831956.1 GIY-YIG nuclease family protein [Massilia sp. CCM 9029]